jgi:PEP-CTERM motif
VSATNCPVRHRLLTAALLAVLLAPEAAIAQIIATFTGSAPVNYVLSEPFPTAVISGNSMPVTQQGSTDAIIMGINTFDVAGTLVSASSICGAGCLAETTGGFSSFLNLTDETTGSPAAGLSSTTLSIVPWIGSDTLATSTSIFATPGSNQVTLQLALSNGDYLELTGATAAAIGLCSLGPAICVANPGGTYFNSFTTTGTWTATLTTAPISGVAPPPSGRQIFLNSADLGSATVSWRAPNNPWLLGSPTSATTTPPPLMNDDVFVVNRSGGAVATTVNYDATTDPRLHSLTIDSIGGATGPQVTLAQASGTLTSGNETIGTTGAATHSQSGGTNNVTGTLTVNPYGTYAMGSGATLNAGTIQVNTGGAFNLTGASALNFSALNISGGNVTSNGDEVLDYAGQSNTSYTVTHSGGTNAVTGGGVFGANLVLGAAAGNSGTYLLSSGTTLSATGAIVVGRYGTGDLQQTGGTVSAGLGLALGQFASGVGTYELSGPVTSTLSVGGEEDIGLLGSGVFTQTGGINTTPQVSIGSGGPNGSGRYELAGGTLNVASITGGPNSTFNIDGGTLNLSGTTINVGAFNLGVSGANGSFTLSGPTQLTATSEYLGYTRAFNIYNNIITSGVAGVGDFTQNGGSNIVGSGGLTIDGLDFKNLNFSSGSAYASTYTMNAGNLSVAGALTVGADGGLGTAAASGVGSFVQTGGTVTANSEALGGNNIQALLDANNNFAYARYTQYAGNNTVATGLTINLDGSYTLNGGNLYTAGFNSNGSFTLNGGTLYTAGLAVATTDTFALFGGGVLNINGGLLQSTAPEWIGGKYGGKVVQTNGNNQATEIDVGVNNYPGSYVMSGGLIGTGIFSVGTSGGGFINGNNGAFTMSGGQLVAGTLNVNSLSGEVGIGNGNTFIQSGGQTIVTGNVNNFFTGFISVSGQAQTGCPANGNLCNLVVQGTLNNAGIIKITNGAEVFASVYNQVGGGTVLVGAVLDPSAVNISGGTLSGTGTIVGNVNVSGASTAVTVGGPSPGALHIVGNYNQTGGSLNFLMGADSSGGFLFSNLVFDPGKIVTITGTDIVFDFANGTDPSSFLSSSQFNLNTFFTESDGSAFAFGNSLQNDIFQYQNGTGRLVDLSYDAATGDLMTVAPVPEPSTVALMLMGLGFCSLATYRRRVLTVDRMAA